MKFLPKMEIVEYDEFGWGFEFTWYKAIGIAFGFGKHDVLIGWPRASRVHINR